MRAGVRLALDWGEARIGVAACDPAGTLAYPVETVPAGPGAVARLVALVGEYEPIEIVVGLPRSLSGGEGPAAATVRAPGRRAGLRRGPAARPAGGRTAQHGDRRTASCGRPAGRAKRQRSRIDSAAAAGILEHALDIERTGGCRPASYYRVADAPDQLRHLTQTARRLTS